MLAHSENSIKKWPESLEAMFDDAWDSGTLNQKQRKRRCPFRTKPESGKNELENAAANLTPMYEPSLQRSRKVL